MSTPSWASSTANTTQASASVNQLLGTHQETTIFEGTAQVVVTGATATQATSTTTPLNTGASTVAVSQPFNTAGGQTEIDRITIPALLTQGMGQDTTVGIYADSSGNPGTQQGTSVTLPREFLQYTAAQSPPSSSLVTHTTGSYGSWTSDTNANLPSTLASSGLSTDYATCTAGNYVIISGGQNGATTIINNTSYFAQFNTATNDLNPWQAGTILPDAIAIHAMCYVDIPGMSQGTGYLVAAGGTDSNNAGLNTVYQATFDKNLGIMGQWSLSAFTMPTSVRDLALVAAGTAVFAICGQTTATTTSAVANVSTALVTAQYGVSSWASCFAMPLALSGMSAGFLPNNQPGARTGQGYIVAAGGMNTSLVDQSTIYYAAVDTSRSIGLLTGWTTLGNLSHSSGLNAANGVGGDTLYVFGGAQDFGYGAIRYNPAHGDTAPVILSTPPTPIDIGNTVAYQGLPVFLNSSGNTAYVFLLQKNDGLNVRGQFLTSSRTLTYSYAAPNVSVPIRVTGLTQNTKYHCVMTGLSSSPTDVTSLATLSAVSGGGSFTALQKVGSGSWTSLATATTTPGVPITVYNGTGGNPVHIVEDVVTSTPSRQTLLAYSPAGIPQAITSSSSTSYTLTSAIDTSTSVTTIAGANWVGSTVTSGSLSATVTSASLSGTTLTLSVSGWTPALFTSGGGTSYTATSASDSGASWTANQYANDLVSVGGNQALILSNTVNTLTVAGWSQGTPSGGSTFTISGPPTAGATYSVNPSNPARVLDFMGEMVGNVRSAGFMTYDTSGRITGNLGSSTNWGCGSWGDWPNQQPMVWGP